MAEYKDVLIEWHDEPNTTYPVIVSVDGYWNSLDGGDDDGVFFYFANEAEFEEAKKSGDNGYEFRIIEG